MKENFILQKSHSLAIEIINFYKHLVKVDKEYIISKQLLRSGTSVGANITEAQDAISPKEFLVKMNIALKECSETLYWISLIEGTKLTNYTNLLKVKGNVQHTKATLINIVKTTKENLNNS